MLESTFSPVRFKQLWQVILFAIVSPIESIYTSWSEKRVRDIYKLEHTGQVYSLRKSLNDRFDPDLRRIEVQDGNRYIREYIYKRIEQQNKFLGTIYLHSRADYADTGVDFLVIVPEAIVSAFSFELLAHIDFYKQDIKRYKIIS